IRAGPKQSFYGARRRPRFAARCESPSTTCCCRQGPRPLRTCGCCCCVASTPSRSRPSLPRVASDSGTITLCCKDLRVLQLEIEGAEATLGIARSIEGLRLGDSWHFLPPERYCKRVAREVSAVVGAREGGSAGPGRGAETGHSLGALDLASLLPALQTNAWRLSEVLLRSSQPLTGPQKRRCERDQELLRTALAGARPWARGFIMDTLSAQAAKQARVTRGGTETKAA
ncbi:myotubularin-related protein 9-like, partial [Gorilla gorilla gorilla]|uniref:myotubularin-related protein 9-like n=1 Tax=Gorilla gorilla gorilla TaxID=9595 RepID=UPI0008F4C2A2